MKAAGGRTGTGRAWLSLFALLAGGLVWGPAPAAAQAEAGSEAAGDTPVVSHSLDAPPRERLSPIPHLTLGARLDVKWQGSRNLDLNGTVADTLHRLDSKLTLAARYRPLPWAEAFVEGRNTRRAVLEDDTHTRHGTTRNQLRNGYLGVTWGPDQIPVTFRAGRQHLKDSREWRYDTSLDAARLLVEAGPWRLDLATGWLAPDVTGSAGRRVLNVFATGSYVPRKKDEISLYGIVRSDPGHSGRRIWAGLFSRMKLPAGQRLWLESATYRGDHKGERLNGYAVDGGWSVRATGGIHPSLTLAGAYGSGDAHPADGVDHTFRQTGLEKNTGSFRGTTDFHYYGEVAQPELSNIAITTADLGIQPTPGSSVELVYHGYRQADTASSTHLGLRAKPAGTNARLGDELDVVAGAGLGEHVHLTLTGGLFRPGPAFTVRDPAYAVEFELSLEL